MIGEHTEVGPRRILELLAASAALLLLAPVISGCTISATQRELPRPDVLTQVERERITQAELDRLWGETGLPESQRPLGIHVVRYISLDEWPNVMAECMSGEGAPAEAEDGGLAYKTADATASAFGLARYVCESRFPTDPVMLSPLNEDQLRYLYSYYVEDLRECLQGRGLDISTPPSEQTFVENYYRTPWDPLSDIDDPVLLSPASPCPMRPEGLFG